MGKEEWELLDEKKTHKNITNIKKPNYIIKKSLNFQLRELNAIILIQHIHEFSIQIQSIGERGGSFDMAAKQNGGFQV